MKTEPASAERAVSTPRDNRQSTSCSSRRSAASRRTSASFSSSWRRCATTGNRLIALASKAEVVKTKVRKQAIQLYEYECTTLYTTLVTRRGRRARGRRGRAAQRSSASPRSSRRRNEEMALGTCPRHRHCLSRARPGPRSARNVTSWSSGRLLFVLHGTLSRTCEVLPCVHAPWLARSRARSPASGTVTCLVLISYIAYGYAYGLRFTSKPYISVYAVSS